MSSSDDYTIEVLANVPIYLHRYVDPILYVIGTIGHILSLLIFYKKAWQKNVCVFYFVICLINNLIFINSSLLGSILTLGYNIKAHDKNVGLCKIFYYIAFLSSTYYSFVLILASFDRLLISSQNVDTRLYSSKRLAYFLISINTFICVIFSLHVLIKVDIQEVYPTVFICYYDLSKSYLNFFMYSTLSISTLVPLTLIILSIVAFKNVRRIRSIPRQQRQQIRSMTKKDFQLLRCLYIHNIVYISCSILIVFGVGYSLLLDLTTATRIEQALSDFLTSFGSFLHNIPYCTNFFIFISISKAFRQELKRMMYRLCRKNVTQIREDENNQPETIQENMELNHMTVSTIALPT